MAAIAGRLGRLTVGGVRIGGIVDTQLTRMTDPVPVGFRDGSLRYLASSSIVTELNVNCRWFDDDIGQQTIRDLAEDPQQVTAELDMGNGERFIMEAQVVEFGLEQPLDDITNFTFTLRGTEPPIHRRVQGRIADWIVDWDDRRMCMACEQPCYSVSVICGGVIHMRCAMHWGPAGREGMRPGWHPSNLNRHDRRHHMRMVVDALGAYAMAATSEGIGQGEYDRLTALREEMRAINDHLGINAW